MNQPQKDIPLAHYTHYKIGGVAREVYFPRETSEVLELVQALRSNGTNYFVLGGGSNVLIGDSYWDGAVIITTEMNHFDIHPDKIICGAGLTTSRVAEVALEHAKTGLEFLFLLPGSIGGALAGNARYNYKSISDVLISTLAVHQKRGMKRFKARDIEFAYKHNPLVQEEWIICELTLEWKDNNPTAIQKRMNDIKQYRIHNHHFDYPSCGCIFKNDYKKNIQAGRLVDSLGLKGLTVGGAQVAPFHANFIINTGNATARDVLKLIEQVERTVFEKTGITLEREIRLFGTF